MLLAKSKKFASEIYNGNHLLDDWGQFITSGEIVFFSSHIYLIL